jgi:arylsulfatase A-like enzyme
MERGPRDGRPDLPPASEAPDPLARPRAGLYGRPSRDFTERIGGDPPPTAEPSAAAVWALSSWIGLMSGLVEGGLRLAWRLAGFHVGDPDLWVNWHAPWMAPLALAALFFGFGVLVTLARCVAPRATALLAPGALVALGAWSALGALPGLHPWAVGLLVAGLAYRAGRHARFDSGRFRRLARASLPPAAALWAALFVATGVLPTVSEAWSLAAGPRPQEHAPNVLLVVLDTVRADNLLHHGYPRPTSPNLSAWARRGVRFDQARATTPYTLGTHASLFTGHWMSRTSARVGTPLDGTRRTLAEHLSDRGYATGGFVGNIFYGSAHYGLNRGFLHYHDIPGNITRRVTPREFVRSCRLGESLLTWGEMKARVMAPMQRLRLDAEEVNREALAWVDRSRQCGRPFFVFVNYFDAHSPYSLPGHAPQPFARLTADRLEARMKRLERAEARRDALPAPGVDAETAGMRAEVNSLLRDSYDDGIAWIDRTLDELLRELEGRGLLDDTLVVVTADHGEMLGEHGIIGHGMSLDRQVVHVPLVVIGARGMGVPGGVVVERPVTVRDVPATVLGLLGDRDAGRFPGRPLSRYWSGGGDAEAADGPVLSEMEHLSWRPHTPRTPAAFGPLWLLTEGRWSYHRQEREGLGIQERLFDLVDDPAESRDLASEPGHLATLQALRRRFERARATDFGG